MLSLGGGLIPFIEIHGYIVLFLIMIFEGPIITYIGAFLASQGVFNIYTILLLSIFGYVIPDTVLFFLGRYSRTKTLERIANFFGLNEKRMEKIERGFSKHAGKSIVSLKLIPGLSVPGIMLAGFSKVSFKRFFIISTILNVIFGVIFTLLGFYSGIAVETILRYLRLEKIILIILAFLIIILYLIIKYFNKLVKRD